MSFIPGDAKRTILNIFDQAKEGIADLFDGDDDLPPPTTVDRVDPERYAGLWHELARLPMRFQADVTVSTAEYGLMDDGKISVRNVAYRGDEVEATIEGTAEPAEGAEETFDRLIVSFGGLLRFIPKADEGNYWILRLADDYSLAMVGTPNRRSLWLLARDPDSWENPQVNEFLADAAQQGYPIDKLLVADWDKRVTSDDDDD